MTYTNRLSAAFKTAGQASQLMEEWGIDMLNFFQLLVEDRSFRAEFADFYKRSSLRQQHVRLPRSFNQASLERLRRALAEPELLTDEHLRKFLRAHEQRQVDAFLCSFKLDDSLPATKKELGKLYGITGQRVDDITHRLKRDLSNYLVRLADVAKPAMQRRIEGLGFSSRLVAALKLAGMNTVGDIAERTENRLLSTPGIGYQSIQEILLVLDELGVELSG